ncbi:MAG: sigma-70 family RNA polymerase sigma factor [Clostridiales bacterium]|nr:sigma-70 family RNA polymerase sigma factor [Clostridiales bacterium]
MTTTEEQKLVIAAKENDKEAFASLIQLNKQYMYKVALAILMNDEDVADAMQDTILTCWEKITGLREERYFKTWMTKILINHCYAIINERKRFTDLSEWKEPTFMDEYNLELKEALSLLDEKYRPVVILYYVHEFETKEIAEILNISKTAVTTRLQRARKKLAGYYNSDFQGEMKNERQEYI